MAKLWIIGMGAYFMALTSASATTPVAVYDDASVMTFIDAGSYTYEFKTFDFAMLPERIVIEKVKNNYHVSNVVLPRMPRIQPRFTAYKPRSGLTDPLV